MQQIDAFCANVCSSATPTLPGQHQYWPDLCVDVAVPLWPSILPYLCHSPQSLPLQQTHHSTAGRGARLHNQIFAYPNSSVCSWHHVAWRLPAETTESSARSKSPFWLHPASSVLAVFPFIGLNSTKRTLKFPWVYSVFLPFLASLKLFLILSLLPALLHLNVV